VAAPQHLAGVVGTIDEPLSTATWRPPPALPRSVLVLRGGSGLGACQFSVDEVVDAQTMGLSAGLPVPYALWPYLGNSPNQFNRKRAGLAMAMRSKDVHCAFDTIHTRHWRQLAMKNGGPVVWDAMQGLVEQAGPR
jgi:hypothetical protein